MARVKTSQLFAKLLQLETISLEDFSTGLQETLEAADDMVIDIPMFWQYMAEMLCKFYLCIFFNIPHSPSST